MAILSALPVECQLEILKKLPAIEVDAVRQVCQSLNAIIVRYRPHLPKVRVFLTVTNELDLGKVTLCVYIHPLHYRAEHESVSFKRKLYREKTLSLDELADFDLSAEFGHFKLESILLTSRHRDLSPIHEEVIHMLARELRGKSQHLRYFSTRHMDFSSLTQEAIDAFKRIFTSAGSHIFDVIKFESCNFKNVPIIHDFYDQNLVSRTRQFKELCSTRCDYHIPDVVPLMETNQALLMSVLQPGSHLDVVDLSSAVHWQRNTFTHFIESWMLSADPQTFHSVSLMKTEDFGDHMLDIKRHPWRKTEGSDEPVVFQHRLRKNLYLHAYVHSHLYFTMKVVDLHKLDL